jgi:hypothetical protein
MESTVARQTDSQTAVEVGSIAEKNDHSGAESVAVSTVFAEQVVEVGDHPERLAQSIRRLGAPVGLQLAQIRLRVEELLRIQEIRETREYKAAGLTWDTYCTDVVGQHPATVEKNLQNMAALGPELLAVAEWAGMKRSMMRALRAGVGGEPLLLRVEAGTLVGPDGRIPIDADHRTEVGEAIKALVDQLNYHNNRADDATVAAREKDTELQASKEAHEATVAEKDEEIESVRKALDLAKGANLKVKKAAERLVDEKKDLRSNLAAVAGGLGALVMFCTRFRPDRSEVFDMLVPMQEMMDTLHRYAQLRGEFAVPEGSTPEEIERIDAQMRDTAEYEKEFE